MEIGGKLLGYVSQVVLTNARLGFGGTFFTGGKTAILSRILISIGGLLFYGKSS